MPTSQDYLYMLQICVAFAAVVAVFLVFRYETIDRYADNRKSALREILEIRTHPERAEWIQQIGKSDNGFQTFDDKLQNLGTPSVSTFIREIAQLRSTRRSLMGRGQLVMVTWGLLAITYLFAQVLQIYDPTTYRALMSLFLVPLVASGAFFRWALAPLH